jgi:uncharacterized membrane protein
MMSDILLMSGSFLASAVEMVEAITIILAVGITRGWRSALIGTVAALITLGIIVALLGPSLINYVPLDVLRIVVGVLLLIFGLQWLRKAILRASGLKELHDEERIFKAEISELQGVAVATQSAIDWTGFVVSFKGVLLEGLEVAFIVLTFGANSGRFDLSIAGALAAAVIITGVAIVVRQPLSRVPENAIKFGVGTMLMAFGTFWGGEGVGVDWELGDLTIVVLMLLYGGVGAFLIAMLRGRETAPSPTAEISAS